MGHTELPAAVLTDVAAHLREQVAHRAEITLVTAARVGITPQRLDTQLDEQGIQRGDRAGPNAIITVLTAEERQVSQGRIGKIPGMIRAKASTRSAPAGCHFAQLPLPKPGRLP